MTIELAQVRALPKPWGRADLTPWSAAGSCDARIGEIWFERADASAPKPALLLKLLFTDEPLSIQVHPDDAFAQSIDLENGKSEAWYVLAAHPHAGVGVGLTRPLSAARLRAAISDRSIASLVRWRRVREGDVIVVPAGMIHTIGAGLVLAEIQQRSDATFRLFDHGREREIHSDNAVAAADTALQDETPAETPLGGGRTVLAASPHFVLERIVLPAGARAVLDAGSETWMLVLGGAAKLGAVHAAVGDAVYADATQETLAAGADGLTALIAYGGPEPRAALLTQQQQPTAHGETRAMRLMEVHA